MINVFTLSAIVQGQRQTALYIALIIVVAFSIAAVPRYIRKHTHHFTYPVCRVIKLDVTGKRCPEMEDCIDRFLIDGGMSVAHAQAADVREWKQNCEAEIQRIKWQWERRQAEKNYQQCLAHANPKREFCFVLVRKQKRYRQRQYQRSVYTVEVEAARRYCSFSYLADRKKRLDKIKNACTLREYSNKSQRNLMTPALRKAIMERDNYTCQICGKYMPDEVGLQIDHIMPVRHGGLTVPENLRVLCSKCNGSKSSKLPTLQKVNTRTSKTQEKRKRT